MVSLAKLEVEIPKGRRPNGVYDQEYELSISAEQITLKLKGLKHISSHNFCGSEIRV